MLEVEQRLDDFDFYSSFRMSRLGLEPVRNRNESTKIKRQGLLYSVPVFLVWTTPLILLFLINFDGPNFTIYIIHALVNPIQGILNFFIYKLPKNTRSIRRRRSQIPMLINSTPAAIRFPITEEIVNETKKEDEEGLVKEIEEESRCKKRDY